METKSSVENSAISLIDAKLATLTEEEKRSYYKTALELVSWYPKLLREKQEVNELAWGLYSYSFYVLWKLRDINETHV